MYSEEQYLRALEVYDETGSITKTITILGYPSRKTLYNWITRRKHVPEGHSTFRGLNTPEHPRHPPLSVKLEALHRCFELGEDVQSVSDEIGYSRASIYTWRRKYIQKGTVALMNPKDKPRGKLTEGSTSTTDEIAALKAQVQDMQLEIDILKETIDVLKKDPGINKTILNNKEKAVIVDALKKKYSLPLLLKKLNFPKSSYYYQTTRKSFSERHADDLEHIKEIFNENKARYGYRRIRAVLNREGVTISEKVVRKIMKDNCLFVKTKKIRRYSSYKGEISPEIPNIIKRNFATEKPNEKWLTDITEFAIPAGKVYLSLIIDCFDGMPVSWNTSTTPDAELVNSMLDNAIATLRDGEHPIVHSDRGCHYRWPGWVERTEKVHLVRSMSKKGCSPDNAACEGFFGRMKNEMFYCCSWQNVTIEEFINQIDEYMLWYRNKRIKMSLGALSPVEYRKNIGVFA